MKRMFAIALGLVLAACLCSGARAADLGLNASNRRIGSGQGVSLSERNGTMTFGYGKIWMRFEEGNLSSADGNKHTDECHIVKDFSENGWIEQIWENGDKLQTGLYPQDNGELILRQTASTTGEGISSVRFSLTVPIDYEIIIPAWNGIRLTNGNAVPYMSLMAYPNNWQAQMLLIQTENGGLLIHANDNGSQFKALNVQSDDRYFYIDIETIPQAPFIQYDYFETVDWAFIPYAGAWQQGAQIYKDYMNATYQLNVIEAAKPDWAHDIQLVCLMDIVEKDLVTELSKLVDPEKTLLHLVNWRTSNYDTNYPDYNYRAGLKDGVDYAHSLGFKVSVHANMLGAHLDNADFLARNLQEEAVLDTSGSKMVIEGYTAFGKDYSFAQINQASTVWQDTLIEQLREVIEDVGVDCVHLDQSLLCFNDGRGLVNGMTTMQGNVELQRRLAEAYPQVIFSGEGINEFNARYASLLQMHVYGLDYPTESWSETWFDQILPITNFLFEDQLNVYHYPALPTTQSARESYYQAWYRAGNQRANDIACLYRMNLAEITQPTLTGRLALWDANFRMENDPKLDDTPWGDDVLLSLKLKNGKTAQWRRDEYGTYFLADIEQPEVAVRFLEGVETAPIEGSIPGWRIYSDTMVLGLDAEKSYLVDSVPFDQVETHISAIEKNLNMRAFEETDDYALVGVKEIVPSNERTVDFMKYDGVMRAGETLDEGATHETAPFSSVTGFDFVLGGKAEIRHWNDRIKFHPPWRNEGAPIGYAWMEVDVTLEDYGHTVFSASPQMASAANAAISDGVLYKFIAFPQDAPEDQVSAEAYVTTDLATPVEIDLTRFEGRDITIRIEVYAGPTTANDSCVLVSPRVVQSRGDREQIVHYDIQTRYDVQDMLSISGKAQAERLSGRQYRIESPVSDSIYFIYRDAPMGDYLDLTCAPSVSVWQMESGHQKNVQSGMEPIRKVVDAFDELYNGTVVLPPEGGMTRTTFLVTLPQEQVSFHAVLLTLAGPEDGITFSLLVNGDTVASWRQTPSEEWQEADVSLENYAGKTILLTMCVDAGEDKGCIGFWGEPYLQAN